jgi:hypothetical protein
MDARAVRHGYRGWRKAVFTKGVGVTSAQSLRELISTTLNAFCVNLGHEKSHTLSKNSQQEFARRAAFMLQRALSQAHVGA